ncbi:MAG: hypothetical protein PHT71_01000 [Victivallaceae bacterium]|nr:hypothetical protein [Victivallaceae bacterium]
MKEGFWGNYQTGHYFEIDEHERWIRRGNNAHMLGVPPEIIARFSEFSDRETLLPFIWQHAPVMRWRGHGASVCFEFHSESWQMPLQLIDTWGKLFAGSYLHLHMVNFRNMEVRETLWKNFNGISDRR